MVKATYNDAVRCKVRILPACLIRKEDKMKTVYKRTQFTAKDSKYHPEIAHEKEYLDFEHVSTGLSKCVISYGYRKLTPHKVGNAWRYEWITRKEFEEHSK